MKTLKLIMLAAAIAMMLNTSFTHAQVNQEWVRSYSKPGDDTPKRMLTDLDGNIYVAGTSNDDLLLIKYSSEGDTLWTRSYNSPENNKEKLNDAFFDDNYLNIYMIGETGSGNGNVKAVVIKYDMNGTKKWSTIFGNPGYAKTLPEFGVINVWGRMYAATISFSQNNDKILSIVKIDTLTGTHKFGGGRNYGQESFNIHSLGSDFRTGLNICTERSGNFGIIRFDTSLVYLGERNLNFGGFDKNLFQETTIIGDTYYGGMSRIGGSSDFILVKTDINGDTLWSRRSNIDSLINGYDSLTAMDRDAQGNIVLYGTYSKSTTPPTHGTTIVKFGHDGSLTGSYKYSGEEESYAGQLKTANNGHFYTTENLYYSEFQNYDIAVRKININGGVVWTKKFGSGIVNEAAVSIETDINGNAYVTCTIENAASLDFATIKYADVLTSTGNQNISPNSYKLSQNYPNPFNPVTKINFSLPKSGIAKLKIFDVTGKEVALLMNEVKTAGAYEVQFDGSKFSSGVYFYKLETDGFVETKKMLLIK